MSALSGAHICACLCVFGGGRVGLSCRVLATACYYSPCDWQCVGEKVIAGVCLWWRGPSGERMLSRLRHTERTEKVQAAQNRWLISHKPFPLVCLLCSSAAWVRVLTDRGLSPSDWAVLKDFTCLDFKTSGLFRSRSASRVNSLQNWQTLSFYLLHWERESVVSASTNRAPKINCQMLSFLFIVDTILLKVYALLSINELALRWTPLRSVPSFLIYPQ